MSAEDPIRVGVAATHRLGPVRAREIVRASGGWEAAVTAARGSALGWSDDERVSFATAPERGERIATACRRKGIDILLRGGPSWPDTLECLGDAPEVLFVRGDVRLLSEPSVAVVGSREATANGCALTARLARGVAQEGWCVVSGLARGIDAAAHEGALAAGADTLAVLGCGIDVFYPPENRALQERIAREGLLVSEFVPGTEPRPFHFPRRNRILAALARGVVVVESRARSGALVTARHALEHGREVYAVPGRPGAPLAAGPLELLRQGARLVRSAADLLEDLGGLGDHAPVSEEEREVLDAVEAGTAGAVALAARLGVTPEAAREQLARLELLGLVEGEGPVG